MSQVAGKFSTSAVTLITEETKPITTATPVIEPVMPITEGVHIISNAFEEQNRPPFLQATRSWNLVPPTQNVTLPQFTDGPKTDNATRNGRMPHISPKAAAKVNGLLIGGAVGGVLCVLLLLGAVWYCCCARQKMKRLQADEDAESPSHGFLGKLGWEKGPFRKKSGRYSVSDLESVSSLGDDTPLPTFNKQPSSPSPPVPLSKLKSKKTQRTWNDPRLWKLFSHTTHAKSEGGSEDEKDDSASRVSRQSPSVNGRTASTCTAPYVGPRRLQLKISPDHDSRDSTLRNASRERSIRSQRAEATRQQPMVGERRGSFGGGNGQPERSRRMPLATVRESSPDLQQRRRHLSDPGGNGRSYVGTPSVSEHTFMRRTHPGQKSDLRAVSSAFSRPWSTHTDEDSDELESHLDGASMDGEYRKGSNCKGPVRATDIPGMAF